MKAVQLDADRITDSKLTEITSELQASRVWRTPTVELVDLPDPTPGPDDVVIRPLVAGIGDDDRRLVSADSEGYLNYAGELNLPCVPGQEFAGFVEATGGHVQTSAWATTRPRRHSNGAESVRPAALQDMSFASLTRSLAGRLQAPMPNRSALRPDFAGRSIP